MPLPIDSNAPITISPDGVALVTGTRVSLDLILAVSAGDASPDEIAAQYSTVTVAAVHAALAYHARHRAAVDAYLADRREQSSQARAVAERRLPLHGLRARLASRRPSRA